MANYSMKKPKLPGVPKMPALYSDKNLNATLPMPGSPPPMSTDRFASPNTLAAPKMPAMPSAPQSNPSLSPRAARFRRLAGLLGPKK